MTMAKLFLRVNGSFGASCNSVADTGHHITEDSGSFTVFSIGDPGRIICEAATRAEAEQAIAEDWNEAYKF